MRRAVAAIVVVTMLAAGCSPVVQKQAFIPTLVAWCAQVNERIEAAAAEDQPRVAASEISVLVSQTREAAVPEEDQQLLQDMLESFEATADRFRAAAEAQERGDEQLVEAEVATAQDRFGETNELATEYGMPPLETCDEVENSETPAPTPSASGSSTPSGPAVAEAPADAVGWSATTEARVARQQVTAARVGGLLYVAGGIVDGTGTTTVEALDTTIGSWQSAPELPIALHDAMAVTYGGNMVVLGGWRSDGDEVTAAASDRVLALRGNRWVDLPPLRRPRVGGAAAVVDGTIVVAGGYSDDGLIRETEIYDRNERAWRDGPDLPTPRRDLAAASDGRYVYAVGGRNLTADRALTSAERYDPATGTWQAIDPLSTARAGLSAAVVDGWLVAVGGEQPTGVLDVVEGYDPASDTWTEFPALPTALHGAGVAAVGPVLYVVNGGSATSLSSPTTVAAVLRPPGRRSRPSGSWSQVDAATLARQQVATAEIDGEVWVVGGLEQTDVATTAVSRLDPTTGEWTQEPDLPEALHHAMAVNLDGDLVVLGGWVGGGPNPTAETSDRVHVLRDGSWQPLASLSRPRAAGAAEVVDGRIVVVGGGADGEPVRPTEVYDPGADRWEDRADIPTPREHLAAGTHDGSVYVVGGWMTGPDDNSNALERYDPDADTWTALEVMPTPRGSISGTVIDGQLVVVGGETNRGILDTVELYDIAADEWRDGPSLPTARHGTGVAAVGSLVCVIGGARRRGHNGSTTEVDVLTFE